MATMSWKFAVTAAVTVATVTVSTTAFTNSTTSSVAASTIASTSEPQPTANATSRNSAQLCDYLQASYSSASRSYKPSLLTTITTTEYWNYTDYYTTSTWSCTSTCNDPLPFFGGKICYADGMTTITTDQSVHTGVTTSTITQGEEYPSPSPTCSVGNADCASLWSEYSSSSTAWSNANQITPAPPGITSPARPDCATCRAAACTISRAAVDFFFWPEASNATTRDMCATAPTTSAASRPPDFPNATWTEVTTGPYAVVNGNTFFSGNVYLSFATVIATWPCRSAETRYNKIITLASTDIFTKRGYPINDIPYSVNYADFNDPVPYSAWYGQPSCQIRMPYCSVVFPGGYNPQMAMPAAIRSIEPAWSDCSLSYFGLDDPPIALTSVGNFLSTSTSVPAVPVTTPNDPPRPTSAQPTPADPPTPPTSAPTARPPTPSNQPPNDPPSDPQDPPSDPQDPPSDPQDPPSDPQDPPSNPQDPPSDPQDPPSDPQDPPSDPQDPPSDPQDPPSDPQDPPSNPNDPPPNNPPNTPTRPGNVPPQPTPPPPPPHNPPHHPPHNPPPPKPGPITITNAPIGPIVVDPTSGIIINPGTTIRPSPNAPPLVIGDTTISVGPTGIIIEDPTATRTIPIQPGGSSTTITAGGSTIIAGPSGIIVAPGTTLQPGGAPVTISGTTISAGPSGIVIIDGSGTQTVALPTGAGGTITVGGSTIVGGENGFVVGGVTLTAGGQDVVVDGTTVSMGASGVVIVDGESTTTVPVGGSAGSSVVTLTLGSGDVVTATSSNGQVVIGGVTLTLGGPSATLSGGDVVSLGTGGVVVGTGSRVSTAIFQGPTGPVTSGGVGGDFGGDAGRLDAGWGGVVGVVMAVIGLV